MLGAFSGVIVPRSRGQRSRHVLKVAATWSLCGLIWLLWSRPAGKAALAGYEQALGLLGLAAILAAFLVAVALYCRALERCLSLVEDRHRVAEPSSVWLMFLIPYNFVEDFYIVSNLARSLRQEALANSRLQGLGSFGMWSGTGWCTAQLVSLVPGTIGEAAGLTGGILWAKHWHFIAKVNRRLSGPEPNRPTVA